MLGSLETGEKTPSLSASTANMVEVMTVAQMALEASMDKGARIQMVKG